VIWSSNGAALGQPMKSRSIFGAVLTAMVHLWLAPLPVVRAWDPAGHLLIGQIAWDETSEVARGRVNELVAGLPNEYNGGQPYHFVTASCWMDDMRAMPGYPWAKWHYVTIPWTPDGQSFALPPPPHVVWAIGSSLEHLRDPQTSPEKRAEAVAMLMHFVQDVHQPLHATDRNNDRGGNGFLIANLPGSGGGGVSVRPATLHFFWDAAYRYAVEGTVISETWRCPPVSGRPKAPGEGVIAEEAAKIQAQFPPDSLPELRDPDKRTATAWARESHVLGCSDGYPKGQEPSDSELHTLPPGFVTRAHEIAVRRVALAGYRLARMLNGVFGNDHPK
jgi:hypothetical protein